MKETGISHLASAWHHATMASSETGQEEETWWASFSAISKMNKDLLETFFFQDGDSSHCNSSLYVPFPFDQSLRNVV